MFLIYIVPLYQLLLSSTYSAQFTCSKQGECENKIITCPPEQACYVDCSGNFACRNTQIYCPLNEECHIKCHFNREQNITNNGEMICQHIKIYGKDSSLLTVNASIGNRSNANPRTLYESEIHCPITPLISSDNNEPNGVSQHKNCQIYCDGDSLMRASKLMAIQGMNDIYIDDIHYTKPWCIRNTMLYCSEDYGINCLLTNKPSSDGKYGCRDPLAFSIDQRCEHYIIDRDTLPTSTPQQTVSGISSTAAPT